MPGYENLLYVLQEFEIAGETRVQAYAFHISRQYRADLAGRGFYSDWEPGRFGPYSRALHCDLESAAHEGYAKSVPTAGADRKYLAHCATLRGRAEFRRLFQENGFLADVSELLAYLQRQRLEEVMGGIRRDYPEYAGSQ